MTGKELKRQTMQGLQAIHTPGESSAITNLLFEWLGVGEDENISLEKSEKHRIAVDRLLAHEPVQYVTGRAWFYEMPFRVTPEVLIPRPETEELVFHALKWLTSMHGRKVLDIGSGSGCIPISMKKKMAGLDITSIDISAGALEVARSNAAALEADVHFIEMDFLSEENWKSLDQYDLIISNPPYIALAERSMMEKNVTGYEPSLALFVPDNDPLLFYRKIAAFSKTHLKPNGKIFLELNQNLAPETAALFPGSTVIKDVNGNNRILVG